MLSVRRSRAAVLAAAALLCSAGSYKPGQGAPAATLTMVRGAVHLGAKSLQSYHVLADDSCGKPALKGRLAALLTYGKASKDRPIDAGAPVYIQATTTLNGTAWSTDHSLPGLGFAMTSESCINFVGFTPLSGHHYQLRQEAPPGEGCTLEVTDLETQSAPPDLVVADAQRCPAR